MIKNFFKLSYMCLTLSYICKTLSLSNNKYLNDLDAHLGAYGVEILGRGGDRSDSDCRGGCKAAPGNGEFASANEAAQRRF
jgi:hypothetical protein